MILRLEQYLARAAGDTTGAIPENPETNTEAYLAILAGENRQAPEPVTRLDMYLYNLIGGNYPIPTPNTRIEQYLAKACGLEIEVPTPITREEQLWHAIAQSSWQLTTLTGALPLSFKSKGVPLTDYKLYGTSEGAGVETESGEPAGFKIPISLESGNLFTETGSGLVQVNFYGAKRFGKSLGKLPAGDYSITYTKTSTINIFITKRDNNNSYSTSESNPSTFSVSSTDAEIIIRTGYASNDKTWAELRLTNIVVSQQSNYDLFIGNSKLGAEEYVDYESGKIYRDVDGTLTPTDPPAPLPEISTYSGENTLSCSEELGEVSITGYIKEAGNG